MTEPRPTTVVAAVVQRDGRYLVCRRPSHKRHGGLWEFPGGKILDGEDRADAVRREMEEELELVATATGNVLFTASDEGAPFVIEFVEAIVEGTPVLREHSESGWFTPAELRRLSLAPADSLFASTLREE